MCCFLLSRFSTTNTDVDDFVLMKTFLIMSRCVTCLWSTACLWSSCLRLGCSTQLYLPQTLSVWIGSATSCTGTIVILSLWSFLEMFCLKFKPDHTRLRASSGIVCCTFGWVSHVRVSYSSLHVQFPWQWDTCVLLAKLRATAWTFKCITLPRHDACKQ